MIRKITLIPVVAMMLTAFGCSLLPSKERLCLDSTRLEFKDPDSLEVVENMGTRGESADPEMPFFWLRYKAKNSYGAYTSGNIACHKNDGKWTRDKSREQQAVRLKVAKYFEVATKDMSSPATLANMIQTGKMLDPQMILTDVQTKAENHVYLSVDPL